MLLHLNMEILKYITYFLKYDWLNCTHPCFQLKMMECRLTLVELCDSEIVLRSAVEVEPLRVEILEEKLGSGWLSQARQPPY